MSEPRQVVLCGLEEREEALFRLLLKRIQGELREPWVVGGDEARADALLVDPASIAGNVAIASAKRRGIPYLVIAERPRAGEARWTIRRPLTATEIARVFNNLPVREVTALPVISAADENFYDLDLEGGPGAVAAPLQEESLPPPRRAAAALQPEDAEALFRRDPLSPSVAVLRSVRLPSDLAIDGGSAPTARHEQRAIESGGGFLPGAPLALRRVAAEPAEEAGRFTLGELLAGGILFAPSECQRADGPRFAVVPKTRELLSAAPLAAFRPLCRARLSRRDFRTLTTPRLAELRRQWATLAFDQLAFLCALVASDGRLRPELDPGGRFWRAGELPLDPSLPDETAILAAMAEPLRLNEIAARSARPMARVIDVVNALAAIGRLGSALRDRLR